MTESEQITKAPPLENTPSQSASVPRKLPTEEIALAALAALSLVGIAVADFSARFSFRYWIAMAPVFAGVSIYAGWARARRDGRSAPAIIWQQVLHWAVLPVAVTLVYLMETTGRLNREDAGLVALLALALTTFLAGVHFDWRLGVLGAALAVGALCAALIEEFFWVFFIVAIPVVGVALWWRRRG